MALIISQGSGATIPTDLIGGSHYSYGKITDGTPGSTNSLVVDANGLLGSLVTVNNSIALKGNITLSDSKGFIGLVTVGGGPVNLLGNVTLTDSKGFIGLVSVGGGPVNILGNVTLTDPKTFIGSVSVTGNVGITGNVTLTDSKGFIGLVSIGGGPVNILGNVTLSDPKTFIGLTTQVPGRFVGLGIGTTAKANFTITLASLASGFARSSTMISNASNYPAAFVTLKLTAGGVAPAHGSIAGVYLIRGDGTLTDDNCGASDSAASIINAPLLGNMAMMSLVSASYFQTFDTSVWGPLGGSWGVAIQCNNAWLSGTEGDHVKDYTYYLPEQH